MTLEFAPTRPAATLSPPPTAGLPLRLATLAAVLLLTFAGASVGMLAWTLEQALQLEQTARNVEATQALAAAWTLPRADMTRLPAQVQARYDLGLEDHIHLRSAEGLALISLDRPAADTAVPDWFVQAWPIAAPPGRTRLALAGAAPVILEVEAGRAWAHRLLWQTVSRNAAMQVLLAAALGLVAIAVLRGWLLRQRVTPGPWRSLSAAQSGLMGKPEPPESPESPDLPDLSDPEGVQATERHLRHDLAVHAEQVLRLQRQAQLDLLTGMSRREHFLAQLQRQLAEPQGTHVALLIVRVRELEALNLRVGREATDRLLCAVAQLLLTYVDRVAGALAGRLNGADFALCLPVGGVALETAMSLRATLAALPALRTAGALAVVGGVDELPGTTVSLALAQADAALARAEAGEANGVAVNRHGDLPSGASGAGAWRQQIAEALTLAHGRLQHTPVQDREGRTLHLACSLHLQLAPAAGHQPPRVWMAMARRAQLLPRVDLLAVQLALHAISADGQPRCVRVAAPSWSAPGFVVALQALLQQAPTQARALALELELAAPESSQADGSLTAAVAAWAPCGVRMGVSQGLAMPPDGKAAHAAGMAFVTVKCGGVHGLAGNAAMQARFKCWTKQVHGHGLLALVSGSPEPRDLDMLWALGLDGAAAPPLPAF